MTFAVTRMIGREEAVAALVSRLSRQRLVTSSGPEAEEDAVRVAIASGHGVGAGGGGLTLPAFRPYESRQQKWL